MRKEDTSAGEAKHHTRRERLADLFRLLLVSNLERVQVLAQSELEFGELLALLDLDICIQGKRSGEILERSDRSYDRTLGILLP